MRIGIFTDTYLPYVSGLVTSELMLKNALEELGHEVFVVTANLENFKYVYDKENKVIMMPGIPIGIYDARLTGIYSFRAMNQIKKWKLDIIHSQTEFGIGTFSRIVSKKLNIPLVHTYHTMYEEYIHYITKGYFKNAGKKLVEYLSKFYCDKTATELIVPSRKIYNLFEKKYKVDTKISIIGTGMDIDRFSKDNFSKEKIDSLKNKLGIKENDYVIGTVSRLGKEKSVDRIINAFKKVKEKIPNSKLLIVGDGPDKKMLEDLANEVGVSDNTIFTGKVPIKEVQIYYQLMDIFTTFSVTETQGLTVIEAMASSLPVLAIRDDSFIDSVKDKKNGFLFNTEEEFINDVYQLYTNKLLYKKMASNSCLFAKEHSYLEFGKPVYNVYTDSIKVFHDKNSLFKNIKNIIKPNKNTEKEIKNE